jgi:hypothetical protein
VNCEEFDNEITDYALNQTPFRNAKSMLATLEKQNLIRVVSQDAKRRRGTFKEGAIQSVEFLRRNHGLQF